MVIKRGFSAFGGGYAARFGCIVRNRRKIWETETVSQNAF